MIKRHAAPGSSPSPSAPSLAGYLRVGSYTAPVTEVVIDGPSVVLTATFQLTGSGGIPHGEYVEVLDRRSNSVFTSSLPIAITALAGDSLTINYNMNWIDGGLPTTEIATEAEISQSISMLNAILQATAE